MTGAKSRRREHRKRQAMLDKERDRDRVATQLAGECSSHCRHPRLKKLPGLAGVGTSRFEVGTGWRARREGRRVWGVAGGRALFTHADSRAHGGCFPVPPSLYHGNVRPLISLPSDPLSEYRTFLRTLTLAASRSASALTPPDYVPVPLNLIDLTASLIISLLLPDSADPWCHLDDPKRQEECDCGGKWEGVEARSVVYETHKFVARTLRKTQIGCSALAFALLYIFRARDRRGGVAWAADVVGEPRATAPRPAASSTSGARAAESCCVVHANRPSRSTNTTPPSSDDCSSFTSFPSTMPPARSSSKTQSAAPPSTPQSPLARNRATGTFLAALITADKYLHDSTYLNIDWAHFSAPLYTLTEINALERSFLATLSHSLHVSAAEFAAFVEELDRAVCLQGMRVLGRRVDAGLTYGDAARLMGRPGAWAVAQMLVRWVVESLVHYVVTVAVAASVVAATMRCLALGGTVESITLWARSPTPISLLAMPHGLNFVDTCWTVNGTDLRAGLRFPWTVPRWDARTSDLLPV
ncbi:hypothetical protein BDK51DRAFT_38109 [Blyttiomyces helicus]|uniref:Cyclin N-terminal domain-containing protein n=1 Tax=Blyttiomyces helicus TaxID=388810 RepID=A0A4P9W459_9FUNG|nr:hypothetical protein BDK51DRAFT_38109 [Blyttiomyces helicus]|eukprot:RKO86662.1 hypothetical protein BDK51DRAFT_38109 [Blyttiomyces helicus]